MSAHTVSAIDALLPQTQCEECGYPGCRPYAQAIAQGKTDIAQCAPGGLATLTALATLLGTSAEPYTDRVNERYREPATAIIDEMACIGCTKCIQACPVDAIIGTGKWMHTILEAACTGCGLCVAPCPVDCITLKPLDTPHYNRIEAKNRFEARSLRLQKHAKQKSLKKPSKETIEATLARALARKRDAGDKPS